MDLVIELISLGRNVREVSKIKVRQPLQSAILDKSVYDIISNSNNGIFRLDVKDDKIWVEKI